MPPSPLFSNQVSLSLSLSLTDLVNLWVPVFMCMHVFDSVHSMSAVHAGKVYLCIHPLWLTTPVLIGLCCCGSISLCKWRVPDEQETGAVVMFAASDCVKMASGTSKGPLLYLASYLRFCPPVPSHTLNSSSHVLLALFSTQKVQKCQFI